MKVLIDADACPVTWLAAEEARARGIPCLLFCDTSHVFSIDGAETVTVSKGADSADFALVNRIGPGDLVITQDYGLAAMCLARAARVLDQNGRFYTDENIDALLDARYQAKKVRLSGGRLKGPKARTALQNRQFLEVLRRFLNEAARQEENHVPD